ncbi:hypothetical protein HID58_045693 [Brassica napus]|uniref:Aquaporin n=1 Tax=Brassica napus TaxID=3708 RepID=A0ABQ8AVS4_BRANA|nr:hypothetical protein HID58_045693 [Brassica napus]
MLRCIETSWNVSRGHVNPAVMFGMAVAGRISVPIAMFYWTSQMIASVMACLVLKVIVVEQRSSLSTPCSRLTTRDVAYEGARNPGVRPLAVGPIFIGRWSILWRSHESGMCLWVCYDVWKTTVVLPQEMLLVFDDLCV